jgi:hypothetical protein
VVNVAARVAGACRALGRLVAAAAGSSRPTTGAPSAAAATTSEATQHEVSGPLSLILGAVAAEAASGQPSLASRLDGGTSADEPVLGLLAIAMIVLTVAALALYGLASGPEAPGRRGSAHAAAQASRRAPGGRGEAFAVLALAGGSLALWSAIALWALLS